MSQNGIRKRRAFKDFLIRDKLILIIVTISFISIFLAFVGSSVYNVAVFHEKQKNKLAILAQIIADNSQAAVSFRDELAARETLASLRAEPYISSAVIYDQEGRIFSTFQHWETEPLDKTYVRVRRQWFESGYLHTYQPVIVDGEIIGSVYLRSDSTELTDLTKRYFIFDLFVFFLCLGLAYILASRFQRAISEPISDLMNLADTVATQKDYSLRAVKKGEDELGELTDRLNGMLAEIEKREEALLRSNEALFRSNRDLEQFAYVASHDLQEPLRTVVNYTDLLNEKMKHKLDPETGEFLGFITEGAARSQQLITDLLQYSRIGRENRFEDVKSEEILNKVLANLKILIDENKAHITYEDLPEVYADPVKLGQVFQNLISNAIKFKGAENPRIHISAKRGSGAWIFSVADNGIGIDPKYQEKIFVIFKRLHGRSKYRGTGIGLSICKRIVEQHGGNIWVESRLHQGSIFNFTLPFKELTELDTRPLF